MEKANTTIPAESFSDSPPVLLLVGGMGTRLRPVLSDKPKPLAPLGDISFLELLVMQLASQGFHRLVMCTGYRAVQIQQEFGDGNKWNVAIDYSEESLPLGTAGAIKLAERFVSVASEFVVMNGDSFLELDLQRLIRFHREHGGSASMAVRQVSDAARYGTVHTGEKNRVVRFDEKTGIPGPGLINGGVYVFSRAILQNISHGPSSLEKDVFPALLHEGIFALEQHGMFIDIGTPEDYDRAKAQYQSLAQAAQLEFPLGCQKQRQR
jgi:D-glycero-alpha-D-manno-heptose 1-phosphate guanylyltransferase